MSTRTPGLSAGKAGRSRDRTTFACTECGNESPKWAGRCPACEAWNTLVEWAPAVARSSAGLSTVPDVIDIAAVTTESQSRQPLGISEFDRVLGGGLVPGSLVLIGGDPGIGKSTLILQAAGALVAAGKTVFYLAGEESASQIKMRADRLGLAGGGLLLYPGTNLDDALQRASDLLPAALIVDSIQTVHTAEGAAPGSLSQLRESTMTLMRWAKDTGIPVFVIGHVTKDGDIAGPRLLEHIVDVVLYLEGDRFSAYRLLRGVKNRFGSIDEVGVFEMAGDGLRGVDNPSEAFIAERGQNAVGSCVVPTLEGSRPVLVEVQALTSPTVAPMPRRVANGLDSSRLQIVSAVLSRRAGIPLAGQDIIASIVGGLRISEPAVDLALALAIASSHRDQPLPPDIVALGEIGLTGELRSVSRLERRLLEAERLGFKRCILPETTLERQRPKIGMELLPAASLKEALKAVFAARAGDSTPYSD